MNEEKTTRLSGWLSFSAAIIFLVESFLYMYGWHIGRKSMADSWSQGRVKPFFQDWNFWGNFFFIVGSIGYQINSFAELTDSYQTEALILDFSMAVCFVIDSLLYLFALFEGEHSRAPRIRDAAYTLRYDLDFYFQGTIFFILGSLVYLGAAVQDLLFIDSSFMNLLGALIFLIDAPLYIISGYQFRDEKREVPIFNRGNILFIETRFTLGSF